MVDATDADAKGRSLGEEDSRRFIPVRVYFFSTRFFLVYFFFFFFFLEKGHLVGGKMWERNRIRWSGSMGWFAINWTSGMYLPALF